MNIPYSFPDWRDIRLKLSTTDVRIHFSDALEGVASTERLFLLTSFANMATTRKESDRDFIETVCLELVEVGFQTPALFESCCKGARDMLANVAQVHPWILSFLVKQMNQTPDLMGLGKVKTTFCLDTCLLNLSLKAVLWRIIKSCDMRSHGQVVIVVACGA